MKSIASLLLLALALPLQAQDLQRGKLLYETHCAACHTERLHGREKTSVKTMADLRDMVALWAKQTKRAFTLDELEDVALYLNQSHYHLQAARELIYGAELMSARERAQYRQDVAAGGEPVRARHRERIRERARQRGVELADPAGTIRK